MVWFICIMIVVAFIFIYLLIPGGKPWKKYIEDIKRAFIEINIQKGELNTFTEDSIAELPILLRHHITNGGYLNHLFMDNMLIYFNNTKFRISAGKKLINIKFMQINFVKRPDRNAFLNGRLYGIPLQAKDSVVDGHGSMTVWLAKFLQLFNVTGVEMDQSQLITSLADSVYMPSLFLQNYINWREIDDHSVEGEILWKGISAKGIFTFNEMGNIIQFDTNDRYMDNGKGGSLVPWRVNYSNYKKQNGYFQPGNVSVKWILPEEEDIYFTSDCIEIKYSVNMENIYK